MSTNKVLVEYDAEIGSFKSKLNELESSFKKSADDAKKAAKIIGKSYTDETQSINELQKRIQQLQQARNNSQNETSIKRFNALIDETNTKLQTQLKLTDSVVTKTTSSFNGLQNSVNQITRELPAFTLSANTGFLAISNNLPILNDQIKILKERNIELAASGQPTVSIFKTLINSVFSLGTALSVGITLLTLYGGEIANFISNLFNAGEQEKKLITTTEELNKSVKDYNTTLKNVYDNEIRLAKARGKDPFELEKAKAVDALSFALNNLKIIQRQINDLEIENRKLSQDIFVDRAGEVQQANQFEIASNKKKIAELKKLLQEANQNQINAFTDLNVIIAEQDTKQRKKDKDSIDIDLKLREARAQNILAIQAKEIELENVRTLKKQAENRKEYAGKVELDQFIALEEEKHQQNLKEIRDKYKDSERDRETIEPILRRRYGEMKKYLEDEKELQFKANQEIIDNKKEASEALFAIEKDRFKKEIELERKLAAEKERIQKQNRDQSLQFAIETANFLSELSRNQSAQEQQDLEQKFSKERSELERQLNNKIISEEQYNARLKVLEDKQAQEQRKLNYDKAVKEKEFARFRVLINTAVAVTKALAEGNILGAEIAAATGLFELIVIESTPLPALAKGTKYLQRGNNKPGVDTIPAMLNEGEAVIPTDINRKHKDIVGAMFDGNLNDLIERKYIAPALRQYKEAHEGKSNSNFADRIAASLAMQNKFSDKEIVKRLDKVYRGSQENTYYLGKVLRKNNNPRLP